MEQTKTQEENKSLPTAADILSKFFFVDTKDIDDLRLALVLNPDADRILAAMEQYRNLPNEPSIDEITRLQNIGIEMANDIEQKRKEIESLKQQLNEPSIQEEGLEEAAKQYAFELWEDKKNDFWYSINKACSEQDFKAGAEYIKQLNK